MICKVCGLEFDGGEFCPHCGAQMEVAVAPEKNPGETFGKISMIVGVVSLAFIVLFGWCGYFGIFASSLSFYGGIAALVFSIIGNTRSKNVGMLNPQAKLGMIFSIITIGLYLLAIFLIFTLVTLYVVFGVGTGIFVGITEMLSGGYYY